MQKHYKKMISIYMISTLIFLISTTPSGNNSDFKDDLPVAVSVYITETNIVTSIPLETYVAKVVTAEMPSTFHIEALKAQAVATRTYAMAKVHADITPAAHPQAPLCNSTHCQVYKSNSRIPDKIKEAVNKTASELLYYNDQLVTEPLYHASSGGSTENSEDVFVSAVPYLRSVKSPYEQTFSRSGHGVGMSQQGANGLAKAGFNYKKILSHYYSGTVVY